MNLAFLTSSFLRTGKESASLTIVGLAKELIKKGHRVFIISDRRKNLPEFEKINNVPIYRLYSSQIKGPIFGLQAVQKKLKIRFDIIHGFSSSPLFALRTYLARKLFCSKSKTIHTLKSYSKSKMGRSFYRLLNLVDLVTVPTESMASVLINSGVNKNKIRLIHSYIDLNKFKPLNKMKLKEKYCPKNKKVLLYYGALFENKGVRYLLKALPKIIESNPNTLLILAPRHKIPLNYRELISNQKIKNNIRIMMEINVPEIVNCSDLVVLPYTDLIGTEGNPSCLLEAVACRTPVLTTNQPELKEIFDENEVFYVPSKDADSLAQKINFILKNKSIARNLSKKAHKKIKDFDIKIAADKFLQLYQNWVFAK